MKLISQPFKSITAPSKFVAKKAVKLIKEVPGVNNVSNFTKSVNKQYRDLFNSMLDLTAGISKK